MRRTTIYNPHNRLFLAVLVLILFTVIVWIFIRALGTAFERVGFSPATIALILAATFFGSYVNIPLLKMKTFTPIIREEFASFFGIVYRILRVEYGEATTLIAFNVGGALVPTLVSAYLLWKLPSAIPYSMIAVAAVAIVTHVVARPVKGVGITTPFLVSPVVAAVSAYLLPFEVPQVVAYVAGVLGTLIGADCQISILFPSLALQLQASAELVHSTACS